MRKKKFLNSFLKKASGYIYFSLFAFQWRGLEKKVAQLLNVTFESLYVSYDYFYRHY